MFTLEILNLMTKDEFDSRIVQIIKELTHEVEHLMWKVKNLENINIETGGGIPNPAFIKNSPFMKEEKL